MKQCRMCGAIKSEDEFPWKQKAKEIRHLTCKVCQRELGKAHYKKNSEAYKARSKENGPRYRKANREFLIDYLKENPCVDCGERDIIVLEFDHREPLLKVGGRVGQLTNHSLKRLKEEIEKCDVVCANCHTRRTAKTFGWYRLDYI